MTEKELGKVRVDSGCYSYSIDVRDDGFGLAALLHFLISGKLKKESDPWNVRNSTRTHDIIALICLLNRFFILLRFSRGNYQVVAFDVGP